MKTVIKIIVGIFLFFFIIIGLVASILTLQHSEKVISFLETLKPTPTITPVQIKGVGVIGDSLSDEYRADDSRGLTYASTTLNWVEILQDKRNINFGDWGIYEEPRREGFAYNFARTGASIHNAVITGQHTGLATEIKKGNVNVVVISVGINDFSPLAYEGYEAIYNGNVTVEQITQKINYIQADMKTIIETLRNADNSVRILLILIPDWGRNSLVQLAFPIPEQRSKVSSAIEKANLELIKLASEKDVATVAISEFYDNLEKRNKGDKVVIGNILLNKYIPGDDPRDMFLDDGVHPGTIYNGLLANFIIQHLNKNIGTKIAPFSDMEIVQAAGL